MRKKRNEKGVIKIYKKFKKNKSYKIHFTFEILLKIVFLILLFLLFNYQLKLKQQKPTYFDKYETYIYNEIKEKLKSTKCSLMWGNQKEFINGIIRKFRPKKIIELGVNVGGSSIIILNSIKDLKNSHLFSIDIKNDIYIGSCVENYFHNLTEKWTLFKGGIAAEFIEKIGKNIDLAMIDTSHFEPGEILDFLLILPFLKEEAIVIFHDIDHQITYARGKDLRNEWAPYIIFNIIRGEKYFPSGDGIFNKDIGAIKLEKNQKRFVYDYCRALGGQWQYFPEEKHIQIVLKFFEKYYDNVCLTILKESIDFNRQFVLDNPKKGFNYGLYEKQRHFVYD